MAVTKAQLKAKEKYEAKAYKKILLRLPKELEEAFLEKSNGSMNGYIINLIRKDLGMEKEKDPE